MAPAGEYEPPEPDDASRVRWLELPADLAPYIRLGMLSFRGERRMVLRIVRELGEPEGYAEAIGDPSQMRELAETITDIRDFFDSFTYGVMTEGA